MRNEPSKIENRVAGDTVGASGDRKGQKSFEDVGQPPSPLLSVAQDSVVKDGQHKPRPRHQQYEKSKPVNATTAGAHDGQTSNLNQGGYTYGVGPASAGKRACSGANIEGEADAGGFDFETQQGLRGKLDLEGLAAVTSSQQHPASPPALTSSRDRQERTGSSLVDLVEGAAAGRRVADHERLSLGSNSRLLAATDITAGITTATTTSSSKEQHALRQDIMSLAREDERETELLLLSTAEQEVKHVKQAGSRRVAGSTYLLSHHDTTILQADSPRASMHTGHRHHHHQKQQSLGRGHQQEYQGAAFSRARHSDGVGPVLSPKSRPGHQASSVAGAAKTRKVVVIDQLVVTSSSLADTVEATLLLGGAPCTTNGNSTGLRGRSDHKAGGGCQHVSKDTPLLWSLLIHRCRLPSLMPVAGLLHRLNTLCSLEIDGILGGLALHGLERVLVDAPCLQTVTLRRCGLTELPCLKSGSVETLDISDNAIRTAAGLENLFRLEVLNMSGNNICRLMDLLPLVPLGAGCLRVLDLDRNSVQNTPRYRASIIAMVASIRVLDGAPAHRPWRAMNSLSTDEKDATTRVHGACTRPSRVRGRPPDGYFSDGGAACATEASRRKRQAAETARHRVGARTNLADSSDQHGFVRGLAGLGLIWGGAPRDQISSFGSSLGMYFRSAEAVRTPRYGVDSASLLRSNSAEVVFDRCKRLAGVSSTPLAGTPSRGNNRRRSPSPARCRQLQRDTIRSQPRSDWNSRFRCHQEQELSVQNLARSSKSVRLSRCRDGQIATMERLARPSRLLHRQQSGASKAPPSPEEDNASFTETARGQQHASFDLVDRPTAVKGTNGRWQGVAATSSTGKGQAMAATDDTTPGALLHRGVKSALSGHHRSDPLSIDGGESSQATTIRTTTPRPFLSDSRVDKEEDDLVQTTVRTDAKQAQKSSLPQGRGGAIRGTITPPRITSHSKLIRSPVPRAKATRAPSPQSPQRAAAAAGGKKAPRSRLPTPLRAQLESRTTLVLPEDWTLKPPYTETPGYLEKAAQPYGGSTNRTLPRGNERWASSSKRSVSPHGSSSSSKGRKLSSSVGGDNSVGAGRSSRYPLTSGAVGRRGGGGGGSTHRSLGEEMAAEAGVRTASPRRRTRASRVLKTSRELAQTLRRVHEVELGEGEARSLYQQLDSDHDGALGADDLVRGASVLATFLAKRQGPNTEGKLPRRDRQGSSAVHGGGTLNRSAVKNTISTAWGQDKTRAQTPTHDSAGNASASYAYYGEGRRARSVGEGEGVNSTPRRLEDWRVPDIDDWPPALSSTLSARHATDEGYRASMLSGSGCREREPGALGVTRTRDVDDYYTGKEERPNHQQYNEQRGGVSSLKHQTKASL